MPLRFALVSEARYTILKDITGNILSVNGTSGNIDFSGTDAYTIIQNTINSLRETGGYIFIKAGTYTLTNLITPAPYPNDGLGTIVIRGEGMYNTILQADSNFNTWGAFNGMIGYGKSGINPKVHQLILEDICLDGNYRGVNNGQNSQPTNTAPALVSIPQPFESASHVTAPKGTRHIFNKVRFYRTPGYGFQMSSCYSVLSCLFDSMGQPDIASSELHYDIIGGGGNQDIVVNNCTYKDSSGNYIDLVSGIDGQNITASFEGNSSINHQIGGVYALGKNSKVINNVLINKNIGSGITYDSGTSINNRMNNIISNNILHNISTFQTSGDIINNNIVT